MHLPSLWGGTELKAGCVSFSFFFLGIFSLLECKILSDIIHIQCLYVFLYMGSGRVVFFIYGDRGVEVLDY